MCVRVRACGRSPSPPPFPTPPGDATGEVGGADAAGRAPRREADGDGAGELSELRRAGGRLGEKGGTGGGRDGGRARQTATAIFYIDFLQLIFYSDFLQRFSTAIFYS